MKKRSDRFFLVREDLLPESMLKTVEAKQLLDSGECEKINTAVKKVNLSRSAFYKYRDGIFPFHSVKKEKIITLSIYLEDRAGALSKVLSIIANLGANVLTINQTIPLQGRAMITLSIETAAMNSDVSVLINKIDQLDPVIKVELIGSGT